MRGLACLVCILGCLELTTAFVDKTVYQYLVDDRHYTTFYRLLHDANLDTMLNGPGPFTVLAPDNFAVYGADGQLMYSLNHNDVQLKTVLKYHILNGFILTPQLLGAGVFTTYEGQDLSIGKNGSTVLLNNVTNVVPGGSDIICNNGIIHQVDSLLLPPVFGMNNIAQVIIMNDQLFQDFFMFLMLSELSEILTTGEYTVFAPVNAAWAQYVDQITHPQNVSDSKHIYREMLKYHIIPGERTASMLHDGDTLYTLHGYPVNITKSSQDIRIDHKANVIQGDIAASNGVVHAIDELLFPDDLYQELLKEYQQTHPNAGN